MIASCNNRLKKDEYISQVKIKHQFYILKQKNCSNSIFFSKKKKKKKTHKQLIISELKNNKGLLLD